MSKVYSDNQIKSIYGSKWVTKNWKKIAIQLAMCIGWVALVIVMTDKANAWVYIAPFVMVIFNAAYNFVKGQKNYIRKVRANPDLLN